ncbi:helix-turn-helix domain-containing protein [Dietzia sp. UCD-THP]|uniref:helix-turn-helix domain-containing protein n=1 Tax=Dietzia sp. UCD-THP TaxID=1292020 RepID=UPI003527D29B
MLRGLRGETGRTLRDVADAARVSPGYLSEIERGRKEASSELLASISGALDVSLGEILIRAAFEVSPPGTVSPHCTDSSKGTDSSPGSVSPREPVLAA